MTDEKNGRFERIVTLLVGLAVMVSMIAYDTINGTLDADLTAQQLGFLIARYGVAGWLINPRIVELVADVVKSVWGRK